jgi:hypothetical protein
MKTCQCCGAVAPANAPHCVRCGEASWKAAPVLSALAEMAEQGKAGAVEVEAVAPLLAALPVEPELVTVDSAPVEMGDMVVLAPADTSDVGSGPIPPVANAIDGEDETPVGAPPIVIEGPSIRIAEPAAEPPAAAPALPVLVPSAPKFHGRRRGHR